MISLPQCVAPLIAVLLWSGIFAPPVTSDPPAPTWSAAGTLLESCTCAVPCTCNFGEGPSPHNYCYAVFGYRLDKAVWKGVDLSGLVVAGADGPKGLLGFLDERATPAQRPALESMAHALFAQGGPNGGPRRFVFTAISHTIQENDLRLTLGVWGGFTAKVIVGRDGKSPVVVENNTIWPIARAIKAKSSLQYQDNTTGLIQGRGTNANYGTFSFSGTNESVAQTRRISPKSGCCAGGK